MKYLYIVNCFKDYEQSLCETEFKVLFNSAYEKYHFSNQNIKYNQSVFIKDKLSIITSGSIDDIKEYLSTHDYYDPCFKIIYYKNDITHVDYQESLRYCRELSDYIEGDTSLTNPQTVFALTNINNIYYFGLLEKNDDWYKYEKKPHSYSHSLPIRIARSAINLGIENHTHYSIIDPCCGVGTVVLEGLALNLNIRGSDINRDVSYKARLNLKHYGYDPLLIERKDIHDITDSYDLTIIDVPYGVYKEVPIETQIDLIENALRISKRCVAIVHVDYKQLLIDKGYKIVNECFYRKSNFYRYIYVIE